MGRKMLKYGWGIWASYFLTLWAVSHPHFMEAKIKKITFDFFKVEYGPKSPKNLKGILVSELPSFSPFPKDSKIHFFPRKTEKMGSLILGSVLSNHMDGLPPSWDMREKKLADLSISDDSGLAHFTSFLFDPSMNF
jgi:hypothetical protein